ncbi:hypothetical protein GGQ86_000480 [Xanthobacter flavus]|uniref:Uncharacterized protein n=1 Tax=Xanthobacter flavus TaxID=281 RepID=A0A9W6CN48_XANFL|nr:hypothetical protein [Xanthobacter flavus]MDR6332033.1 hypothetical protein [Xanthobacter flavus]GLI22222.1 hypothetical protein XFLAVUS301_18960 [Xanthobacter flavus]
MSHDIIHIDRVVLGVLAARTTESASASCLALIEGREDKNDGEEFRPVLRFYGSDAHGLDRIAGDAFLDAAKAAALAPYYRPDEPRPDVLLVVPDAVLAAIWLDNRPRDAIKLPSGVYDSRNPVVSAAVHTASSYYQTLRIVPLSALLTLVGPGVVGREWAATLDAIKVTMATLEARLSEFDLSNARTTAAPLPVGPFFDSTGLPPRDAFDFPSIFQATMAWENGELGDSEEAA